MELILKLLKKQPEVAFEIIRGYINQYKPVAYGLAKEYLSIATVRFMKNVQDHSV